MSRLTYDYDLKQNIDKRDTNIIKLLIKGDNNKVIASKLNIPLSTVQRRTSDIMKKDLVISIVHLNYAKFGYHTGLIHVYISDGNIKETAKNVLEINGITSVEIHIGNSDILADFVYKNIEDILDIIVKIKQMNGIEKAFWSERVLRLDKKDNDIGLAATTAAADRGN
jgi:Lrp/AsnC family transcriptional regulator, regulator for asnA, asnC and gidA